ncbi:archaellin/type IV pilin N-terminal domain-containing protein [Thermoproteota archaeon]
MGVSPVLASIIMISITLAGGMAIWSYVNTTSSSITESYGQDVSNDINNINEDFIITYFGLNSTSDTVAIWMYNNGQFDTVVKQLLIWSLSNITATSIPTNLQIAQGEVGNITVSHSVTLDETYYVKVIAQYGTSQSTYRLAK